jgi:membrane-associated protease RseP (regulator of RpoE activity)
MVLFQGEEQAMRRMYLGTILLIMVLAFRLLQANRAAAQETLPAPGADEMELGFEQAIPPQSVENTQPSKDFSQAYLGVTFDSQIRDAAVARSVTAGSPADSAGVRAGDTIEALNGRRIASYDEVLRIVSGLRPGDVLDIDVSRRVSVSIRAVLDGVPEGGQRTTSYRAPDEPLPVPTFLQERPATSRPRYETGTARPRPSFSAPDDRRSNVNRYDRPTDRGRNYQNRGRLPRRRG